MMSISNRDKLLPLRESAKPQHGAGDIQSSVSNSGNRQNSLQALQPAKRQIERIESQCIYRVIVQANTRLRELKAVLLAMQDEYDLSIVTDVEIRNLLQRHLMVIKNASDSRTDKKRRYATALKTSFEF